MNLIIGIDPDKDKSGCAVFDKANKAVTFSAIGFFELQTWLAEHKENIRQVKVEASWLIAKSNFHTQIPNKKIYTKADVMRAANVSARIGKDVGANHETGRKIVEMCEHLKIDYKLTRPFQKIGKTTKNRKITHDELAKLLKPLGIEIGKRSNQETRDAILIAIF